MADETAFHEKTLHYVQKKIDGDIGESIAEFDDALALRPYSHPDNETAFLPNMESVVSGISEIVVNSDGALAGLTAYKVNKPGFFYYQHWKGLWNPSGYVRILVCSSSDFKSSQVYELLNTRDTTGRGNDHTNNMFPIRPGSNTHVLVIGTLANATGKSMYFVPAYKATAENAVVKYSTSIPIPTSVVSGNPNDEGFKNCFK